MQFKMIAMAAVAAAVASPGPVQAVLITGLAQANQLVSFDSSSPGLVSTPIAVTGLAAGERLLGIDYRPATGQLFGLGSTSQIYVIDPGNGAATAVGGPFLPALSGTDFGFAFNPVPDRIRVVSDADQNLRLNPNNGAAIVDGVLAYNAGDPNFGVDPNVNAVAYTNQRPGPIVTTTLFDIDIALDILATQNPPNAGTLNTVGPLGVNAIREAGFDIDGFSGIAYASLFTAGAFPELYTIDLTTGAATQIASIGAEVLDIAVSPVSEPFSLSLLGLGLLGILAVRRRA